MFVSDWKDAWKWFSVHLATIMAVLNALQASAAYFSGIISATQMAWINAALGIAIILGRLLQQ